MKQGHFVISLDFELFWGVRDTLSFSHYHKNILGVRHAIPRMLELFDQYAIHCTFATVGFLFSKDKNDILNHIPAVKPGYDDPALSPYHGYLNRIGDNEKDDPYHYGDSLIRQIQNHGHEIGSHTFSHYYCLAEGQTLDAFRSDMIACQSIAYQNHLELRSLVFPKNQYSAVHLTASYELGMTSFRGCEKSWLYTPKAQEGKLKRALRLIDSYINLSGHHCYDYSYMRSFHPYNIPSSRFLRPYHKKLSLFDFFKKRRITKSMTYAAKNGLTYHLWWHPHNFGVNIDKNIQFLESILRHYDFLKNKYDFKNVSMGKLSEELKNYEK